MKSSAFLFCCVLLFAVYATGPVSGVIPGTRQFQSLMKAAHRLLAPTGRRRPQSRSPIKSSTTTSHRQPLTALPLASPVDSAEAIKYLPDASSSGSSNVERNMVNPADFLGQLAISFDKSEQNPGTMQGTAKDIASQVSGVLPILMSVAKPMMTSFKGVDGYGTFMEMLQDAKEMFSNREVIRQINQFLDELLSDNDSQTPPTPSDSSLNSLAQIAQSMESLFNVPQSDSKQSRKKKDMRLINNEISRSLDTIEPYYRREES